MPWLIANRKEAHMKNHLKFAACAALALSLPGCAGLGALMTGGPVSAANQTVLDEQAAISLELAYKAARTALEIAVDSGFLKGDNAAKAAALDNQAFAAVTGVRAAYKAGNASNYGVAMAEARAAVTAMLAAVKG
jgi:hypothetical protein